MLDTITLFGLILAMAMLWIMSWSLLQITKQQRKMILDLRRRTTTLEIYILGMNRDDKDIWEDYNGKE